MSFMGIAARLLSGLVFLICVFIHHGGCAPARNAAVDGMNDEGLETIPHSSDRTDTRDTSTRGMAAAMSSDIVPAERLYDWGAYCGIPGGIPQRTTIFQDAEPGRHGGRHQLRRSPPARPGKWSTCPPAPTIWGLVRSSPGIRSA